METNEDKGNQVMPLIGELALSVTGEKVLTIQEVEHLDDIPGVFGDLLKNEEKSEDEEPKSKEEDETVLTMSFEDEKLEPVNVITDTSVQSSDSEWTFETCFDNPKPLVNQPLVSTPCKVSAKSLAANLEPVKIVTDSPVQISENDDYGVVDLFDESPILPVYRPNGFNILQSPDKSEPEETLDFSFDLNPEMLPKPRVLTCRGICNPSSSCYANATLQALMHCPGFVGLVHYAAHLDETVLNYKISPTATALVHFYSQIRRNSKRAVSLAYVEEVLRFVGDRFTTLEQEDAEEFLGMLLNKLHDEEVAFTRNADTSNVSDLMRGNQQYLISLDDGKQIKSDSPFFCLPLSIEERKIKSVQGALKHAIVSKLEGDKMKLTNLPPILIVQLKCFSYNHMGAVKVVKPLKVNKILKISSEHLSEEAQEKYGPEGRNYILRAVVVHRGSWCCSGHYTTYLLKDKKWILIDDDTVHEFEVVGPLKLPPRAMPYLLFYEACSQEEQLGVDDEDDPESIEAEGPGRWCVKEKKEPAAKRKGNGPRNHSARRKNRQGYMSRHEENRRESPDEDGELILFRRKMLKERRIFIEKRLLMERRYWGCEADEA